MPEKYEDQNNSAADHARALELEESLSRQLNKTGREQITTIVNNVVLGPQRTEGTEFEMAARTGKSREEIKELIDAQNRKTDDQAVEEVLAQVKKLGILKNDAPRFIEQLTEYVILMNRLKSVR